MTTPSPQTSQSGQNVETAGRIEQEVSVAEQRHFDNRVCVVIADEATAEETVRRWLGDALPLRITSWRHHAYQEVIRRLRPRVVVVLADNPDLAWDSANLIACLFSRFEPTVVSASFTTGAPTESLALPHLLLHHLGFRTQSGIASLAELTLFE